MKLIIHDMLCFFMYTWTYLKRLLGMQWLPFLDIDVGAFFSCEVVSNICFNKSCNCRLSRLVCPREWWIYGRPVDSDLSADILGTSHATPIKRLVPLCVVLWSSWVYGMVLLFCFEIVWVRELPQHCYLARPTNKVFLFFNYHLYGLFEFVAWGL